jgi:hypothetical protein
MVKADFWLKSRLRKRIAGPPFGLWITRRREDDFRQSESVAKKGLHRIEFSGNIGVANCFDIPRLAGTPARPNTAGFVFLGVCFSKKHETNRAEPLGAIAGFWIIY